MDQNTPNTVYEPSPEDQAPLSAFRTCVDCVFVIDATGSMRPLLDNVKKMTLDLYDPLIKELAEKKRNVDVFRVRVVVFRDFYADGDQALIESPFYTLPEQQGELHDFVTRIEAKGGGDLPENALEALAVAMKSEWTMEGDKRRHIIMLFTDTTSHPFEMAAEKAGDNYPPDMPHNLQELIDRWNDPQSGPMPDPRATRLIIYAPDDEAYQNIASGCQNTTYIPCKAGDGNNEQTQEVVLAALAGSV